LKIVENSLLKIMQRQQPALEPMYIFALIRQERKNERRETCVNTFKQSMLQLFFSPSVHYTAGLNC